MATGQYPLRLLQLGFEGTAGTIVAATQKLVGSGAMTPEIERVNEEFPRGVRAVFDSSIDLRKGVLVQHEGNLTYEEILYPLLTGITNDASPTGSGPYTWTTEPVLSGAPAVKTASAEFVVDDGSTKHYQFEAGYCVTRSFEIGLAANQPATLSFEMFGRAEQTSTVTGSLSPNTGRAVVPSNLFKVFIDTNWANRGNTQKSGLVRSATLNIVTGLEPDYALDGRADLDFTGLVAGQITGTLSLVMEHNGDAATEYAAWRSGALRFVRLSANNGASSGDNRQIIISMPMRYMSAPTFSEEDGLELLSAELELRYDATGAAVFEAKVLNGLSAQP